MTTSACPTMCCYYCASDPCRLHGVQSVDSSWSVGANIYFSSTVTGQMVTAKVEDMDMKEKASLSVSLTISSSPDSMSLVDGLVDSGYALPAVALVPKYDGPTYLPHPLPTDKEFVMAVVCVESDGQIVGQLESDRDILTALMTKVTPLPLIYYTFLLYSNMASSGRHKILYKCLLFAVC